MSNASSLKGNPASKRMGNLNRKARRERSWLRGQKRKAQRREAAAAAHAENIRRHEAGELTPWERAKAERHARRHPREAAA